MSSHEIQEQFPTQFLFRVVETLQWETVALKRHYKGHEVPEMSTIGDDLRHLPVSLSISPETHSHASVALRLPKTDAPGLSNAEEVARENKRGIRHGAENSDAFVIRPAVHGAKIPWAR